LTKTYTVGFEQVQLLNGLGEDQPVWLFTRGRLYNANDPATTLWENSVGSLPPAGPSLGRTPPTIGRHTSRTL
jgi:hypothetical protein